MTELTDLEAIVLGVVDRSGPVTSYAVAQEFGSSPTSHWSGSVGAIYPAMSRLSSRGLVEDHEGARGRRAHRTYTITAAGRASLRSWLQPPFPNGVGGPTEDPIRSRIFFLSVLSPRRRVAFMDHAIERVRSEMTSIERLIGEFDAAGDAWAVIGLEGSRFELEARLEWLRDVKRRVLRMSKKPAPR